MKLKLICKSILTSKIKKKKIFFLLHRTICKKNVNLLTFNSTGFLLLFLITYKCADSV